MKRAFILISLLYCFVQSVAQPFPYRNKNLPIDQRVSDLLSRMTLEEKFWQLFMIPGDLDNAKPNQYKNGIFGFQVSAGAKGDAAGQLLSYNTKENAQLVAKKINSIQKYFVEQSRLGIPIIAFDEALHGLVRDGATAFPQAIALAATWDTTLMQQTAAQIAKETKQRGIRQILSPVVNIASDVRWGRTEETYGEDPFLSSAMGVAFMKSFEQLGIITTPKHFVANVGDGGRDSYPIHANERLLDEIYFPPFKAAIQKAGARSIMTAYNSLDGTAASANQWLLIDKLKKEWGFKGFVISDANAVGGEVVLHYTAKDYATSGEHAINNGLDVIFQTDYDHYKLFIPAFLENKIDTARLNDAVSRVLRAKFELGLFENPYVSEDFKGDELRKKSKEMALESARASFVLLKNEHGALPIAPQTKTIAVFGAEAREARMGGYSGPGTDKVSILEGIKQRAGRQTKVVYALGAERVANDYQVIDTKYLKTTSGQQGLKADYFNNLDMDAKPAMSRVDQQVDFHWTLFSPSPELAPDLYAVRWTGTLTAPETGHFKIGLEGNDGYRLYINNKLVVNRWNKQSYHSELADYSFEKGHQYAIKVEFFEANGDATIKLVWNVGVRNDWKAKIQEAVTLARTADMAIAVVGINEGEFSDRALLSLPGHQEELIKALVATGKPVTVILIGGSAVTMSAWADGVKAIGCAWYPGEEGGHAVASVLFGDYNPAGRLPITFPQHEAQLPLVYNHKPTGRGNDYNNLSGVPLFPFGYGLSYTSFAYSDFSLSKSQIAPTEHTTLTFTLKNIGNRDGDEVVQLYIRDLLSSVVRPVMELKGFQRIHLKAGESRQVSFNITPELLSMLNKEMQTVVEPGDFRIMVGASSRDLRLKGNLQVK